MSDGRENLHRRPSWEECMELLDGLPAMPLEERAGAIERLVRNPSPGVRERTLRMGAAVLSDDTLVAYLRREDDAVLRNAGLEILKQRGGRSFGVAVELLRDPDPAIALQAVQVLDHLKDPRAVEPLRAALRHEDINVVQAAIVAVGNLGDARAIPDLMPFLEREPWLQLAAVQALGGLRSASAVEPLARLLTDLSIGPLAAEALARVGGPEAYDQLARHWLRFHQDLDPETALGLLAHVLEGLVAPPAAPEGMRTSLAERLRDPYREVRLAAARCLLALGPGPEDGEAVHILAAAYDDGSVLPSCLAGRSDLAGLLLSRQPPARSWGFLLLANHPEAAATGQIAQALAAVDPEADLPAVGRLLRQAPGTVAGEALLDLLLRLPAADREGLLPLLSGHRQQLTAAIQQRAADLDAADRVVLSAASGEPAATTRDRIAGLPGPDRLAAIPQLASRPEIVGDLPWEKWLESEPEVYGDAAARVAVRGNLRQLLPSLRRLLAERPTLPVVRAIGELGDADAVPALLDLAEAPTGALRALAVESLGRVGGEEARQALRRLASGEDPKLARIAFKALAGCATEEDDAFFRDASSHSDWYVRLACAEALGRFARARNLSCLSRLAADPIEIVSRRALAALEA